MKHCSIPVSLLFLLIAASVICGCAEEEQPVATPAPTPTPIPEPTPVPTLALSPACRDLLSAADTDMAFLNFFAKNATYSRVYTLAYEDCRLSTASRINEEISKGPKPGSPYLSDARKYLMTASTYCFEPDVGTAISRTKDEMNSYLGKMSEYNDLVFSCSGEFDRNISSKLENSMVSVGTQVFRDNQAKTYNFRVKSDGIRTFGISNSGGNNFSVSLKDAAGKSTSILDNITGPYTGKRSEKLVKGNYQLLVTGGGSWAISVFNP